jgi:hypothetical protein
MAALFSVGSLFVFRLPSLAADAPADLKPLQFNMRTVNSPANEESAEPVAGLPPQRLALGINDLGGQLRVHFNPSWAVEARFLTGNSSSNEGTIQSFVFGVRGYRFFREQHHYRLYVGLEGDYAKTSIRSDGGEVSPVDPITQTTGFGDTSGYAVGGFGGIEYRLFRRVAIDLDIGPYVIGLKEKVTSSSDASLDFVLDTAINIYLF